MDKAGPADDDEWYWVRGISIRARPCMCGWALVFHSSSNCWASSIKITVKNKKFVEGFFIIKRKQNTLFHVNKILSFFRVASVVILFFFLYMSSFSYVPSYGHFPYSAAWITDASVNFSYAPRAVPCCCRGLVHLKKNLIYICASQILSNFEVSNYYLRLTIVVCSHGHDRTAWKHWTRTSHWKTTTLTLKKK